MKLISLNYRWSWSWKRHWMNFNGRLACASRAQWLSKSSQRSEHVSDPVLYFFLFYLPHAHCEMDYNLRLFEELKTTHPQISDGRTNAGKLDDGYGLIATGCHYHITVTSQWARWSLKSPASRWLLNHLFRRRSKKIQSSTSPAFVSGIHLWQVDSPHKEPVTRKIFPFDDAIVIHAAVEFFRSIFVTRKFRLTPVEHLVIRCDILYQTKF